MINWTVRWKNKAFWVALIPALLLLIQAVAQVFGYKIDFGSLQQNLLGVVNAVFTLLAILGIVVDPTTTGVSDSVRAMSYEHPSDSDRLTSENK